MKKQEFADLFDIDLGDNLESNDSDPSSSFEDTCSTVQLQMKEETPETEPEPETDNDIIMNAINSEDISTEESVEDDAAESEFNEEDYADEVERDLKEFSQAVDGNEKESEPEVVTASSTEVEDEDIPDNEPENKSTTDENPLNLNNFDFNLYKQIKQNYPRFNLYSGSRAFKDFYRLKFHYFKSLLGKFPVLDVRDMTEELSGIDMDHVVRDDEIGPSLILRKIGDVQRSRIRIGSLMIEILAQYYMWDRFTEILKSKLYKDHEIRGAHKKDAVIIEHMDDMETYVMEMKGFIENSKHCDNLLKAAAEALSRQLTCLQLKDSLGLSPMKDDVDISNSEPEFVNKPPAIDMSGLDVVEEGTVIAAPKKGSPVSVAKFGEQEDEFSGLGL